MAYGNIQRECQRRYRQAHKEEIAARRQASRAANAEKLKEQNRKYNEAHKQTQNEQMRAWWKENREHYKEIRRKYYSDNKQAMQKLARAAMQKLARAWYLANREKANIASRNSRARANGSEGFHTIED